MYNTKQQPMNFKKAAGQDAQKLQKLMLDETGYDMFKIDLKSRTYELGWNKHDMINILARFEHEYQLDVDKLDQERDDFLNAGNLEYMIRFMIKSIKNERNQGKSIG